MKARERVPTGRRGRPSKSMIAAALERPFCSYLHKICLNNRLEGHRFCIDHIMNDKTAPYRLCTFVHAVTGRRCTRAAHKVDRRASPLCQLHKALRAPPAPTQPIEAGHHLGKGHQTFWLPKGDGSAAPSQRLCSSIARYKMQGEVAPIELPTMEEMAARHNNADSDTESVDNQDIFQHASLFTEEEISRTLRDKMIKLRRLYVEQYGHIQYVLKEKRLKFIQAQRYEDHTFGEANSFRNYSDCEDYAKLRALLKYHKTFGPQSLLQDQAKRMKLARPPTVGPHHHPGVQHQQHQKEATPAGSVCIFAKTAQGCDKSCVPLSPYCRQHILYDNKQVLFRPCAGGDPPCLTPVVSFKRKNKCLLHTAIN